MNNSVPSGHDLRMKRARRSLEGLSIGDAFGERFFYPPPIPRIEGRVLPGGTWHHTDDTAMACSIVEVLATCAIVGGIVAMSTAAPLPAWDALL